MKERPILFSGPMIRAILKGRKTQTRRVVKQRLEHEYTHPEDGLTTMRADGILWELSDFVHEKCPYGQPGDRLWVREAHCFAPPTTWSLPKTINPNDGSEAAYYREGFDRSPPSSGWRPSIFMPRWACRILLDVEDVRIERLQDITPTDTWREGIDPHITGKIGEDHEMDVRAFRDLWDSINEKKHPWESNPWVWVVTFKQAGVKREHSTHIPRTTVRETSGTRKDRQSG